MVARISYCHPVPRDFGLQKSFQDILRAFVVMDWRNAVILQVAINFPLFCQDSALL